MKTIKFSKTKEALDLLRELSVDRFDQYSDAGREYIIDMYSEDHEIKHDALNELLHELTWMDPFNYLTGTALLRLNDDSILIEWHASRCLELEDAEEDFENFLGDLFGIPRDSSVEDIFNPTPSITISGDIGRKVTLTELIFVAFIDKHFFDEYDGFTKAEARKIKASPAFRLALQGHNDSILKREIEKRLLVLFRHYDARKSTFYLHYNGSITIQTFEKKPYKFRLI